MHVSCRESRRPHPGILEPPAAAGHDRDAISGEQLVPLRLAERRPYCRAACPRHRRLQLDCAGRTGAGHRRWRPAVRAEPGIGEIFDHHCVQHTCPDGSYSFSECRQQPGCWSNFSHHAHGTKGFVSFDGGDAVVIQLKGSQPKRLKPGRDGRQTEWDDLLAAVVANRPYNELDWAVDSTLTAILGRMATYSAKLVTWDEAVKSDLTYAPDLSPGTPPHAPRRTRTAFISVPCRASRRPSDRGPCQLELALTQIGHGQNTGEDKAPPSHDRLAGREPDPPLGNCRSSRSSQ